MAFLGRLGKFNLASLVGAGVNLGSTWLFTDMLGLYYLLSNIIGIILATLWNYLANNWWTWSWRR
jgi:dolichol-phosphate mannosyltransferase